MIFEKSCRSRKNGSSTPSGIEWRRPCLLSVVLLAVVAIAAALTPRTAFAQDSGSSSGEDAPRQDGVRNFESVTVDRVKPHDLPTQAKPGAPVGIRTQPDDLPRAPTEDQLAAVRARVRAATVRVAVVKTPRRPYRQEPRVSFGHAVWVNVPGSEDEIALITTLDWVADADQVFVVPSEVATKDRKSKSWMKVRRRTLQSVTAGAEGREWYEEHEDDLVEIELAHRDKHRNLVTLSTGKAPAPSGEPLTLFPYAEKGLFYAYGYSPFFGNAIAQTTISPTHPDKVALSYYFQTSFPAALGAPIVSDQGKLVTITAFRHPDDANITLAIPTQAIESYLAPEYARKKREGDKGGKKDGDERSKRGGDE